MRKAERNRRQKAIVSHLEDLPRQYAALESAMARFGADFALSEFKAAHETTSDLDAYNYVQAVERALGRVQNYVAELATNAVKLADLEIPDTHTGGDGQRSFEALRDAGVIDSSLCRSLIRAQKARVMVEHDYVDTPAGDVHRAAKLVHESTPRFLKAFVPWLTETEVI